jgi:hypothetical protein
LMAVGVLAFFGMLIGAAIYSDNLTHAEKMSCMEMRGDWIGKTCIFRR